MVQMLQKIDADIDPLSGPNYMNLRRVNAYRQLLARATALNDVMTLRSLIAQELLSAGHADASLRAFGELEQLFQQNPAVGTPRNLAVLHMFQATAHLWQGELDNCLRSHEVETCLFPTGPAGVQRDQRATRKAIEALTAYLKTTPGDLRAVWLLNIAAMRVGEYPQGVPAPWRIDPGLFAAEGDIGRFPEVAAPLGLGVNELAGSSVTEDFDGDGHLDIMASAWDMLGQLRLFRNNGDGTFTERTREAGLIGETGALNLVQADYNNDGRADVLMLRGAWFTGKAGRLPNSLLRNDGGGTFTDVTEEAKLLSFHPTQTAAWLDFNNDGWVDLFIGNESSDAETHPCELYRNSGDGTFTECAAETGVAAVGFVKGVTSADYDNDGWPDLYLSMLAKPNILYRNEGPQDQGGSPRGRWRFTDVGVAAGVTEPLNSFPTWFWDYDEDGWQDLFVAGYGMRNVGDVAADYLGVPHPAERARLYRNKGDGTFEDVTRSARLYKVLLAMGANYGDLDNDGWQDFYVGTGNPDLNMIIPNRMFRSVEGRFFQEVTTSGGFGHLHKGHGVSFADLDNDGDQDIYIVMGGAYSGDRSCNLLFENPGHGNRWLALKLEGVKTNRAALGARIKVVVETGDGKVRTIHRTVGSGGSFGANPLRQEIGLGRAKSIRTVEVHWPATRQTQALKGLAMDGFYRVREGEAEAVPWRLKSFKLASGRGGAP